MAHFLNSTSCHRAVVKIAAVTVAATLHIVVLAPPAAAQCLEDSRRVQIGKGATRLKGFLCRTKSDPGRPSLRVEYLNVEEPLASVILDGRSSKHLSALLGKPQVLDNDVLRAFKELRSQFGEEREFAGTHEGAQPPSLVANAPGGEKSEHLEDVVDGGRTVVALPGVGIGDFPDLDGIKHVTKERTWPQGYAHFYSEPIDVGGFRPSGATSGKGADVLLWRYLTADDLSNLPSQISRYNAWVREVVRGDTDYVVIDADKKRLKFETFLLKDGVPPGFAVVYGSTDTGCGDNGSFCCWNFSTTSRKPSFDLMVVQNVGSKPIKLTGFLGQRPDATGMRPREVIKPSSSTTPDPAIAGTETELSPGARILVPLRLRFDVGETLLGHGGAIDPNNTAGARRGFQLIQSARSGTVLNVEWNYNDGSDSKIGKIEKVRESFESPKPPIRPHFTYGPEWRITGLDIGGEKLILAAAPLNALAMTTGSAEGSCPYLTAWNADSGQWTEYGKMLHKANTKRLEQTDVRRMDGFRGQFKLEEREAEIAYIDKASLEILLADGRELTLEPDVPRLRSLDKDYLVLMWDEAVDFKFVLPDGIVAKDVVESRLALSGYYERYSAIATSLRRFTSVDQR